MQPGWCQPVRQEFMENECEALPGVAYPRVRDNRSTINTKTGYDDDDDDDLSKQYGARRLLSELPDKGRKLGSINSLLKRICKTGTIVRLPRSGRPRLVHSSGGPRAQSGGQAKMQQSAREILHETANLCSSVHRIIHSDLQFKCFKTTSCSAVV